MTLEISLKSTVGVFNSCSRGYNDGTNRFGNEKGEDDEGEKEEEEEEGVEEEEKEGEEEEERFKYLVFSKCQTWSSVLKLCVFLFS